MEEINKIILGKDMRLFSSYLDNMCDINNYILIEKNDATKLNLLHFLSGYEPFSTFLGDCLREFLKRPNADIDATGVIDNNYGITAAHIAVQWRNISSLKILVKYNPDLLKCDSSGKTVQDYAEESGIEEMMNIVDKAIEQWYANNHDLYESFILKTSGVSSAPSTINSSFDNHILEMYESPIHKTSDLSNVPSNINSSLESLNSEVFKSPILKFSGDSYVPPHNNGSLVNQDPHKSPIYKISDVSYVPQNINGSLDNHNSEVFKSPNLKFSSDSYLSPYKNRSLDNQNSEMFKTPVLKFSNDSYVSPYKNSSQDPYKSPIFKTPEVLYVPSTSNNSLDRQDLYGSQKHRTSDVSYVPSTTNSSLDSNVSEVYLYKDEAYNIQFIEERFNGAPRLIDEQRIAEANRAERSSLDGSGNASSSFNRSTESVESTIDELILKMTNTQLFDHLVEKGEKPGPVNERTKRLYQKKANRMINREPPSHISFLTEMKSVMNGKTTSEEGTKCESEEEQVMMAKLASYPLEFTNLVKRRFPFEEAIKYENMLIKEFDSIEARYEDGIQRDSTSKNTYFSYLLLDPEITDNLPARANLCLEKMLLIGVGDSDSRPAGGLLELLDPELFAAFILAIFYVGKGCNARAYAHFYEAFKAMAPSFNKGPRASANARPSAKVEKICSIWRKGKGPISLHCFQGISENEALTREALMIDVLSLSNLTNSISGQYRCKLELNRLQRNILGTYLLFKAFIILLLNGERQVKMPEK